LVVTFVGGSSVTEGPGYFSLSSDGESFDGTAIPIGGTNPKPLSATLKGTFSTTSISDPIAVTIQPTFTVTLVPSGTPNLVDGDSGAILATTGTGTVTPEPRAWMLLSLGLVVLIIARWRRTSFTSINKCMPMIFGLLIAQSEFSQVVMPAATTPSSAVAGINNVNVTASGIPAGTVTPGNVIVSFEKTCGGAAVKT
jgi:hypothetical protein